MKRLRSVALLAGVTIAIFATPLAFAARGAKPSVAVLPFQNKTNNPRWNHGGAEAAQDVFVTELMKSGTVQPLQRRRLEALAKEKNLTLSGNVDPSTAARVCSALGVNYVLMTDVTEYGVTDKGAGGGATRKGQRRGARAGGKSFAAALNAKLIDTSTGEIVWADQARQTVKVSVFGVGGGVDDQRIFQRVAKPVLRQLAGKLGTANLKVGCG